MMNMSGTPTPREFTSIYVTPRVASEEGVTLDGSDPFEAALIQMTLINRKKRADYSEDGKWDSNFVTSSEILGLSGFGRKEAVAMNISQKMARLRALRANGRMGAAQNESVLDTYLDLAVYAAILLGMGLEDAANDDNDGGEHNGIAAQ